MGYPLAPENTFPVGLQGVVEAYDWLAAQLGGSKNIILGEHQAQWWCYKGKRVTGQCHGWPQQSTAKLPWVQVGRRRLKRTYIYVAKRLAGVIVCMIPDDTYNRCCGCKVV